MRKEKTIKYIVTGTKKFSFSTRSFKVCPGKQNTIEADKQGNYKVGIGDKKFTGKTTQKKQNRIEVLVNGNTYHFVIESEKAFKRKKKLGKVNTQEKVNHLKSPMPGKICEVFVSKGDTVRKGEPLLILEAMKMQNQLLASDDYKITAVHVKGNDNVMGNQLLIEMEK